MKIRLLLLFSVSVSTLGAIYGSHMGYWSAGWAFLPAALGLAVLGRGVLDIGSQMFVKTECSFVPEGRQVMLTFDDGPDPEKTPQIVALLEKYGARGVFFCIGKKIDEHPATARLITEKGHVIGSHSYYHGNLFDLLPAHKIVEELRQTENAIKAATGEKCVFFRPPYGVTNPNIEKALKAFRYRVVGWNLRSLDTLIHQPAKLEKRVLKRIRPGSIILLHDTAPAVLPVLESVLVYLKENGYRTKLP